MKYGYLIDHVVLGKFCRETDFMDVVTYVAFLGRRGGHVEFLHFTSVGINRGVPLNNIKELEVSKVHPLHFNDSYANPSRSLKTKERYITKNQGVIVLS